MPHLTLALLGTPEVYHGPRRLAFRTRKTLALLAYLAAASGMPSRDKLTALLWPDSDERHGRALLRRTLAFLRQNLEETSTGASHLIVDGDVLGFEFTSDFEVDLRWLEQAASARSGQPDEREIWQQAAGLYRGDFLDGFSLGDAPEFDDWVGAQREYWRRRMQVVFDRLTQRQAEAGDRAGALASLARWLSLDPLNETAYQRLMLAHLASGNRAAALEVFGAARAALAGQLGVEPAPETLALAERARAAGETRQPPLATGAPAQAEGPLVGRADEFSRLVAAFHAARQGRTQWVMLEGEAGIGKTRLAGEFVKWAMAEGARVLRGQAFESGGRLPYQPVVEALRAGLAQAGGRAPEVGQVWLGEIAQLLPELRENSPDLPRPVQDEAAAQTRLFEAVARWGEALSLAAPLVVWLDDVHWADTASLDLLQYCARRWLARGAAVMLLGTLRPDMLAAPSGTGPLAGAQWLSSLPRDLPLTRLSLGPLDLAGTTRYLEVLAGEPERPPALEPLARWLFTETNGQPFFIVETIKALLQQRVLNLRPAAGGLWTLDLGDGRTGLDNLLPPGVRELIRGRLARLRPAAANLLAAGSVLGRDFSFETLCQVARLTEDAGLPAWDELLASGLLAEGGAPARYRFRHDKIRDVAYTEAGEARRQIFHRRALEMLAAEGAPAAELAHHALAARQLEAVYRHSQAAGDDALRLFAAREAVAHYERARRAAQALKAPGGLGHLHRRLASAYQAAGDYAKARVAYEAALQAARDSVDAQLECITLNRLATLAGIHSWENQDVGQYLQQALQVAQASGDTLGRAETEWNLGHFAFYAGDLVAARQHAEQALRLAREIDARKLVVRSLNVLGYVELGANDWAAAEARAEQARPLYAALGDRAGEADSLLQLANARLNTGRLPQGLEPARAARALDQALENDWGLVLADLTLAHGLREAGEAVEALAVAQEGAQLCRQLGMQALSIFMLAELGSAHRAANNLEAAAEAHLEARAINEKFPTQPFAELVAAELCADRALAGDWAAAGAYAQQALAERGRMKVPFFGLTLWLETEALLRAGQSEAARADVAGFGQRLAGSPRFRIPYLRALAVLAAADGNVAAAIAHLRAAAALARELGLPDEIRSASAALAHLAGGGADV